MDRYVPVLVGVALLVGAVGGYAAGGLSGPPSLDDPRVDRFERTASGCRGTVDRSGGVTTGPGGNFAAFGVMDTRSPNASLSMEITRTSPEDARVTTDRVDLASHPRTGSATGENATGACAGEVAYRLNLTVDYREAMRVAVYEDGEIASCGGVDCTPLMADDKQRWWANGSV